MGKSVTLGQFVNDTRHLRVTEYSSQCVTMRHTWVTFFLRGLVRLIGFLSGFAYLIGSLKKPMHFCAFLRDFSFLCIFGGKKIKHAPRMEGEDRDKSGGREYRTQRRQFEF